MQGRTGSTSDEPPSPEPGEEEEEFWPEFPASSPVEGPESPTGVKSLEEGEDTVTEMLVYLKQKAFTQRERLCNH